MSTTAELFTIGQLARRTGVPARTIRFWSDAGLVPPAARSGSGYRLYDVGAVARLDLVRTLRELGLGLDVVQAVLSRTCTVAEVAAVHVAVFDTQIRTLRLRRAVLSTVASGGHSIEETLIMHKLARLSAQERQRIIDDFVDDIFAGTDPAAPAAGIARGMRQLPVGLPDDPAPEQVNAWVELAELVASEDFRQRARSMVLASQGQTVGQAAQDTRQAQDTHLARDTRQAQDTHLAQDTRQAQDTHLARDTRQAEEAGQVDYQAVAEQAGQAAAQGIAPGSPDGNAVLDRIVAPGTPAAQRARLLEQLETFTDARVERYWQLLAIINGQPVQPSVVPGFEWLIAALRAGLS